MEKKAQKSVQLLQDITADHVATLNLMKQIEMKNENHAKGFQLSLEEMQKDIDQLKQEKDTNAALKTKILTEALDKIKNSVNELELAKP